LATLRKQAAREGGHDWLRAEEEITERKVRSIAA